MRCSRCSTGTAEFTLNGERVCAECGRAALAATTIAVAGRPGLDHEISVEPRQRQRAHTERTRTRSKQRAAAERRAVARLKLIHLPEFQAIIGEELRAEGIASPTTRPLDIHLRQIMSRRLMALAERA